MQVKKYAAWIAAMLLWVFIVTPASARATESTPSHDDDGAGPPTRFGVDTIGTERHIGVGLDVGWPFNGLNVKAFVSPRNALQLSIGYNYGYSVKAEYLGHPVVLLQTPILSAPLYMGVGAGYIFGVNGKYSVFQDDYIAGSSVINAHVPLGIALQFRRVPLDFFLQIEPGLDFTLAPAGDLMTAVVMPSGRVGMGGRFYF